MNGSLETIDHRPALRFERRLPYSVERVWRAITDPDELGHWFPSDEALATTEVDPPRVLAGTWYGESLRFELTPDGAGCVLTFLHVLSDRATGARTAAGWEICFARLDAVLANGTLSEVDALRGWPEVHERYADAWGLDPEVGRRAFAEHPLTKAIR